jgi:hypothetical protein
MRVLRNGLPDVPAPAVCKSGQRPAQIPRRCASFIGRSRAAINLGRMRMAELELLA